MKRSTAERLLDFMDEVLRALAQAGRAALRNLSRMRWPELAMVCLGLALALTILPLALTLFVIFMAIKLLVAAIVLNSRRHKRKPDLLDHK